MTNQTIPAEAVEAAAVGLALQAWGDWEYVPDELRLLFLRDAQIAIEAAAPHMLAGRPKYGRAQLEKAWDRCANSDTPWINPYRKGDK